MAVAVLGILVLGVNVGGLALLLRGGISAGGHPGLFPAASQPGASSNEVRAAGRAHFADHCAICHANDGSGQTEMGRNLYPRATDLRLPETQQLTDGELFYIIENGVRLTGMPAWGDGSEESKRASWHLVTFIRHLPELTREEKLYMERLNPKSTEEWREMQEDEKFLKGNERSCDHPAPANMQISTAATAPTLMNESPVRPGRPDILRHRSSRSAGVPPVRPHSGIMKVRGIRYSNSISDPLVSGLMSSLLPMLGTPFRSTTKSM